MPHYSNTPPDPSRGPALPIRRTPAYKQMIAVVTSDDLVGCPTHYYHGKTIPCEAPNCDACADGISYRWHAYMAAVDTETGLHFLFECTAQAAEHFVTYRDAHSTLRGCCFKAERLNHRPNGRVIIQTKPYDTVKNPIPQAPNLPACLAILWDLPKDNVTAETINPERNQRQINPNANHPPNTNPLPITR